MTGYLVDRDVLGELEDPYCHRNVLAWSRKVPDNSLHLSAITVMEGRKGFAKLRANARTEAGRQEAVADEAHFEQILNAFGDRILAVDRAVADRWGEMLSRRDANVMDAGVAATAAVHGLVVATRNLRHFRGRGVPLVDPFAWRPKVENGGDQHA